MVEGSSQFVIWNVINQYWNWQYNNFYNPDTEATAEIYIAHLQTNITAFDNLFKNELLDYYDYTANLTAMSKLNWTSVTDYVSNGGYGTDAYNESLTILNDLYNGLTEFIFYEFNVEVPEDKLKEATSTEERIDALQGVFITIFWYFLISAGVFLIILACMYWSGKKNKTKWEYVSIVVRTLFGLGIALVSVSLVTPFNANGSNSGYYLFYSPWMVPLVVIVYFIGMFGFFSSLGCCFFGLATTNIIASHCSRQPSRVALQQDHLPCIAISTQSRSKSRSDGID